MNKRLLVRMCVVAMVLTILVIPFSASAAPYGLVSFWGDVRLVFSDVFEGGLVGCTVELYSGDTLLASCPVQNVAGAFSFHKNLGPGAYTVKVVGVDDAYTFQSAWVGSANADVAAPEVAFEVTSAQVPGRFGPIVFKYGGGADPECAPSVAYVFGRAVDLEGNGLNGVQWVVVGRHTVEGQSPNDRWKVVSHGVTGGHMPDGSDGGWFGASIRPGQYDEWFIAARCALRAPSGADSYSMSYMNPVPRYENDPWVMAYLGPFNEHVWGWHFKNSDFECMPTIIGAYPTVGFLLQEPRQN